MLVQDTLCGSLSGEWRPTRASAISGMATTLVMPITARIVDGQVVCVPSSFYSMYGTGDCSHDGSRSTIFYGTRWQCWRAGAVDVALAYREDAQGYDLRVLQGKSSVAPMGNVNMCFLPPMGDDGFSFKWQEGDRVFSGTVERIVSDQSCGVDPQQALKRHLPEVLGPLTKLFDNASAVPSIEAVELQ